MTHFVVWGGGAVWNGAAQSVCIPHVHQSERLVQPKLELSQCGQANPTSAVALSAELTWQHLTSSRSSEFTLRAQIERVVDVDLPNLRQRGYPSGDLNQKTHQLRCVNGNCCSHLTILQCCLRHRTPLSMLLLSPLQCTDASSSHPAEFRQFRFE